MKKSINFTDKLPTEEDLYELYQNDGWNDFLKLPKETLYKAMQQSWYVLNAYNHEQLIATGRIISDGVINGYVCGIIVHPDYRNQGIGKELVRRIVKKGMSDQLHIQLLCDHEKASYYEQLGFASFSIGMKYVGELAQNGI